MYIATRSLNMPCGTPSWSLFQHGIRDTSFTYLLSTLYRLRWGLNLTRSSETSDDETFSEDLHNLQELELACRKEDVVRIRELFRTTLLNRGDATNFLRNALPDRFELMRCLLEHGADPNLAFWSEDLRNLDALKLLTEFGFDIQSQGHLFLQ